MSEFVVLPKDVWEAIGTIKSFCNRRVCRDCPLLERTDVKCTLRQKSPNSWFEDYATTDDDHVVLKKEEE